MYKQILVVNLGGIGDILLSTPALRALKGHFPQADISLLAVPRVCEAVKDLPYISGVHAFPLGVRNIFGNLVTLLALRRKKIDLAINMRTLASRFSAQKIRLLLAVIRPRLTAGRDTGGKGYFFDFRVPETLAAQKYAMEYDNDTVRALGAAVPDLAVDFTVSEQDEAAVRRLLSEKGIGEGDAVIGIHPGGQPSRRWPIENFLETMKKISALRPCRFILTGDRNEKRLSRLILREYPAAIDCTGSLTLKELGAVIKRCQLFISNDTGPMHIAAILKVPLIAVFGPGDITRYDPRNISDRAVVLYKKAECAPCYQLRCNDKKCLTAVSPAETVDAALKFI